MFMVKLYQNTNVKSVKSEISYVFDSVDFECSAPHLSEEWKLLYFSYPPVLQCSHLKKHWMLMGLLFFHVDVSAILSLF
jgi:hypothetical protein